MVQGCTCGIVQNLPGPAFWRVSATNRPLVPVTTLQDSTFLCFVFSVAPPGHTNQKERLQTLFQSPLNQPAGQSGAINASQHHIVVCHRASHPASGPLRNSGFAPALQVLGFTQLCRHILRISSQVPARTSRLNRLRSGVLAHIKEAQPQNKPAFNRLEP